MPVPPEQPAAIATMHTRCAYCGHPVTLVYRMPGRADGSARQVWNCPRWRCMKPNSLELAGELLDCRPGHDVDDRDG